jgi:hypothetical protein
VHLYSPTVRALRLSLFFASTQAVRAGGSSIHVGLRLNRASGAWSRFLRRWKSRRTTAVDAGEICRVA